MALREWEELSPEAKEAMAALNVSGPTVNAAQAELKGYHDGEKFYLSPADLDRIADGCKQVALWLRLRARCVDAN